MEASQSRTMQQFSNIVVILDYAGLIALCKARGVARGGTRIVLMLGDVVGGDAPLRTPYLSPYG